jgi:hypothetical protein
LNEVGVKYGFLFAFFGGFVVFDPAAIVAPVQVVELLWLQMN